MRYIYIVFSSRRDSMVFYEMLSSSRVRCETVSTPRKLNLSCGISVRTDERNAGIVKRILYSRDFRSFAGIYVCDNERFSLLK